MGLVYKCDFCGLELHESHYLFSVQQREPNPWQGPTQGDVPPQFDVPKAKTYTIHTQHFVDDPAAVATALYNDFNDIVPPPPEPVPPPPEPVPEPVPEPAPEPAPEPPPPDPIV